MPKNTSVHQFIAVCFALLSLAAKLVHSQSPAGSTVCGGHGRLVNGKTCVCDKPRPALNEWGYAGPNCDLPVFGAAADGSDLTEGCQDSSCNYLNPNNWMCFTVPLRWKAQGTQEWNYLAVQLARTSNQGDPDLYGLFYGTPGKVAVPGNSTLGYDFREISSSVHQQVTKLVQKSLFEKETATGVFLCVKAYGSHNLTFSLRAFTSLCPASFSPDGDKLVCSSLVDAKQEDQRYLGCSPQGQCLCKEAYRSPVVSAYEGLGFEECAAQVVNATDAEFGSKRKYTKTRQVIPSKSWTFYAFNITEEDYRVIVQVEQDPSPCEALDTLLLHFMTVQVYMKYGQPPGRRLGQWDFRPDWTTPFSSSLSVDRTDEGFQNGLWYAGLSSEAAADCTYTFTISKYICPADCSGHGVCVVGANNSRVCNCDKGYFGIDCAWTRTLLKYGETVFKPESYFKLVFYQLPQITPAMLQSSAEVHLQASFDSHSHFSFVSSWPELLLLNGEADSVPQPKNFTFKQVLEEKNKSYEISLCPSQLSKGIWRAAIYNPLGPYNGVAYNISVFKRAICLNNCSGHGDCSEDGVCKCHGNFTGGDCSVNPDAVGCHLGTVKGTYHPELHGTCWHMCICQSYSCTYNEWSCALFTCDAQDKDGRPLRRKGTSDMCVTDSCTEDAWYEDETKVCLQRCACPEDGGACMLQAGCTAGKTMCKPGYTQVNRAEPNCIKTGCQEGSLMGTPAYVQGGTQAYGICKCSGEAADKGGQLCAYETQDQALMHVSCQEGYTLRGAVTIAGSDTLVGGTCAKVRWGTPAWGVALWVVATGVVGLCGSMFAYWLVNHKLFHRKGVSGLYQELSDTNGF